MIDASLTPLPAELRSALAELDRRTTALTALSDAALRWRPPDGGWSVGQALEHLVRIHEPYLARMRLALELGRERARTGKARPWKPTMLGRLIVRSMAGRRKVKTSRQFEPGPETGPGAADRFLAIIRAADEMVQSAEGADLRIRFVSPVARVFRPNLGDAFLLLAVHGHRHLEQIERVLAEPSFPGSGP